MPGLDPLWPLDGGGVVSLCSVIQPLKLVTRAANNERISKVFMLAGTLARGFAVVCAAATHALGGF